MRLNPILALALALGSSGCVYVPLGSIPKLDVTSLASGNRNVTLRTTVSDGGYRTQTVINPWTRADIRLVVVKVLKLDGTAEKTVFQTVEKTTEPFVFKLEPKNLEAELILRNLAPETSYRVRAQAYNESEATDAALISDDEASFVDIVVKNDDRPVAANLPIKLRDKLFAGEATSSLNLTEGTLTNIDEIIELGDNQPDLPV